MIIKNKIILTSSIIIIAIGLIVISLYISKPKNSIPSTPNTQTKSMIAISTDKNQYSEGEIIDIVVKNGLDKSVLYSRGGDRFWGIEYFKNNEWVDPGFEEGGGFQLTEESLGYDCYMALYERMPPITLESQSSLSAQWNQKICPFGTGSPADPRTVEYIGSGKYRLVFNYGFEISENDPYRISNFKKIYSNVFTIN
jgi:hypothetical protein